MPGTVVLEKLNTAAAARIAGVGEGTIRAWARSGQLPHEVTVLGMLVARDDLESFLEARARRQRERVRVRQIGRLSDEPQRTDTDTGKE